MTCLIIDDNPMARITLNHLAIQVPDLDIVLECCNAVEAYNFLQLQDVDILFLDIEMPEMTGIELVRNLKNKDTIIIFTTCKNEYAAEAFELNVADYLIKPFTTARFLQAVGKAKHILESRKQDYFRGDDDFIFVRYSSTMSKLSTEDILYMEAMGDYVKFHTIQKAYTVHATLKSVEARLSGKRFMRIHRSYIAAVNKIETMCEGGLVIGGKYVPVADSYRKALNTRIKIF